MIIEIKFKSIEFEKETIFTPRCPLCQEQDFYSGCIELINKEYHAKEVICRSCGNILKFDKNVILRERHKNEMD